MSYTVELAHFCSELSFGQLPKAVIEKAKMCVLDTIGVMAAASTTEPGRKIVEFVKSMGGRKEATVVCSKFKTSCLNVGLVNGAFVEIPESQDGLRYGGIHQCSAVIPAALAVGERERVSGRELITAVVLGYDVSGRVAAVTHPEQTLRGFIPVGTVGPFGGAAAVGKILEFNRESMINALGIAGLLAPISRLESFYKTCKPFHGGQAAYVSILSALLARAGFNGSNKILEGYCGGMVKQANLERLTHELGQKFEIMETYLKPYTSCRHTHAPIEATLRIVEEHDIEPKDVKEVQVKTYNVAYKITGVRYPNVNSSFVDVQFSIPYTIAVAIMDKQVGLDQISPNRINDSEVNRLAKKVKVTECQELTQLYPGKTAAVVEIVTKQGAKYTARVDLPKGDPRNPFSWEEVKRKFDQMSSYALEDIRRERVTEMILELEDLGNISEVMELLS